MNHSLMTAQKSLPFFPNIEKNRAAILEILERTSTPVFLGERLNLIGRYHELENCLAKHWGQHIIGYSFKTNYLVAKSGIVHEWGAAPEVVSGHEYRMARELDFVGSSILFNGPCKSDEELRTAFNEGALVFVNDSSELERAMRIASEFDTPVPVGLRVSSALPKLGPSRFGFSLDNGAATAAIGRILQARKLNLVALHTHLHGDTDDETIYATAARRMGEFAKSEIPDYQTKLKYLDLGGGFPAHSPKPKSRDVWNPQPIEVYIETIANALRPYFIQVDPKPTLIVEPGRYLTCDGILMVSRVLHVAQQDNSQIVVSDSTISMVPLTHYCPQIIGAYSAELNQRDSGGVETLIYGASCRENDLLYQGMFPSLDTGDLLVHFAAGAYNSNLSPTFIFPPPGLELF